MWRIVKRVARTGVVTEVTSPPPEDALRPDGARLRQEILAILGRSLAIRVVDAGSCNGCELEINALNNPYYNLEGLGVRLVASPRHADLLLVTGPVSRHMAEALRRTYDAMPDPRLVVAVGDCGCHGGVFGEDTYACVGGVSRVLPVDVSVPGCPPAPAEILRGILSAVSRRTLGASAVPVGRPTGDSP